MRVDYNKLIAESKKEVLLNIFKNTNNVRSIIATDSHAAIAQSGTIATAAADSRPGWWGVLARCERLQPAEEGRAANCARDGGQADEGGLWRLKFCRVYQAGS